MSWMSATLRAGILARVNSEQVKLDEILKTLSDQTQIGKKQKTWKSLKAWAMRDNWREISPFVSILHLFVLTPLLLRPTSQRRN